jgi:hypothetical protein
VAEEVMAVPRLELLSCRCLTTGLDSAACR